jgi:hypothetical protein
VKLEGQRGGDSLPSPCDPTFDPSRKLRRFPVPQLRDDRFQGSGFVGGSRGPDVVEWRKEDEKQSKQPHDEEDQAEPPPR